MSGLTNTILKMWKVSCNTSARQVAQKKTLKQTWGKEGLHIVSWIGSGRTVNLLTRLTSKFSNLMSSRCCCMVVSASEWTKQTRKKLDAFLHKSLRRVFKIYRTIRVPNKEIRRRAGLETISKQVARRRWPWLGHVLRMDHYSHPRITLTWVPEGKRKSGSPHETWRRTIERELKDNGLGTWAAVASAAENRTDWRQRAYGLILH